MLRLGFGLKLNPSTDHLVRIVKILVQTKLLNVTRSIKHAWGGVEKIYYLTPKASQYVSQDYILVSNLKNSSNIAQHSLSCLKIIKMLGLSEKDYLTEMELNIRYNLLKKQLGLETKPRMCDFAYIDPKTKQFVGVEVELFMKSKQIYVSNLFDPLEETIDKIDKVVKLKRLFGTYLNGKFNYVKTKESVLRNVKLDAQAQGLDPNQVKEIKTYNVLLTDEETHELVTESFPAFSIDHVKVVFKDRGYDPSIIKSITLKRNKDCIFARHYYALGKNFYNRIDWYFPKGKEIRFKQFLNNVYENKPPKFFTVSTFDPVIESSLNIDNLMFIKKTM